ncbi:MAG TPA: response regulator transcription factor [Vicinamibacterales bacterium]|nr:response regulator transcription factor [Vicinamibacterales bacterium]
MIRVALVDDQTLMREGLRRLLELTDDITVVAEAADGVEAVEMIPKIKPDVVLLDVRMPRLSGLDVLKALRQSDRLPPTILLTTFDDDGALLEGIRSGARGFLLKDVSLDDLTRAIRDVAAGATLMRPAITERILRTAGQVAQDFEAIDTPERLSKREIETLRLMAGGHSNREIADAFGTTEGTVKNHVSNILLKLGVKSRTQAVLKGMDLGYLGTQRR